MNDLVVRNRRTAVLALAGIGFFHLVAFGVVVLLLSAGHAGADRQIPQRPLPRPDGWVPVASLSGADAAASQVVQEDLEAHWTARHKDAPSPWSVDDQGRVAWR
jgi:hypothetical protein